MNKFSKAFFITLGISIFVFLLGFLIYAFFMMWLLMNVIGLLIGLGMLTQKDSRETGGGILAAVGIFFLIGFSVCSSMTQ